MAPTPACPGRSPVDNGTSRAPLLRSQSRGVVAGVGASSSSRAIKKSQSAAFRLHGTSQPSSEPLSSIRARVSTAPRAVAGMSAASSLAPDAAAQVKSAQCKAVQAERQQRLKDFQRQCLRRVTQQRSTHQCGTGADSTRASTTQMPFVHPRRAAPRGPPSAKPAVSLEAEVEPPMPASPSSNSELSQPKMEILAPMHGGIGHRGDLCALIAGVAQSRQQALRRLGGDTSLDLSCIGTANGHAERVHDSDWLDQVARRYAVPANCDIEDFGRRLREPRSWDRDGPHCQRRIEVLVETLLALGTLQRRAEFHAIAQRNMEMWDELPHLPAGAPGKVSVVSGDWGDVTLKLTRSYGKMFAVLNAASTYIPGGGYIDGSPSQEEDMFRRTDCHFSVDEKTFDRHIDRYTPSFIDLLKATHGTVYLDDTRPRVCIRGPEDREASDLGYPWLSVDNVFPFYEMRSAALEFRGRPDESHREYADCTKRVEFIIEAQLETLKLRGIRHAVLSDFGCGTHPAILQTVAQCYYDALEARKEDFDCIVFAIPDHGDDTYYIFKETFQAPVVTSPLVLESSALRTAISTMNPVPDGFVHLEQAAEAADAAVHPASNSPEENWDSSSWHFGKMLGKAGTCSASTQDSAGTLQEACRKVAERSACKVAKPCGKKTEQAVPDASDEENLDCSGCANTGLDAFGAPCFCTHSRRPTGLEDMQEVENIIEGSDQNEGGGARSEGGDLLNPVASHTVSEQRPAVVVAKKMELQKMKEVSSQPTNGKSKAAAGKSRMSALLLKGLKSGEVAKIVDRNMPVDAAGEHIATPSDKDTSEENVPKVPAADESMEASTSMAAGDQRSVRYTSSLVNILLQKYAKRSFPPPALCACIPLPMNELSSPAWEAYAQRISNPTSHARNCEFSHNLGKLQRQVLFLIQEATKG